MKTVPNIVYTITDEAPALATYSLLPIVRFFSKPAGIHIETRDISLAGRILAAFPDFLEADSKQKDDLAELGAMTLTREANIIKLPNISASIPQLKAAIAELQSQGYSIPSYPDTTATDAEKEIRSRYDKIKGSAVNPVLREGNSDRRAPKAVKEYARQHPHSMGVWAPESRTSVATMTTGDFFSNEKSVTVHTATTVHIELKTHSGKTLPLRENLKLQAGEIFDATVMEKQALLDFLAAQIENARQQGVLFSLHLKATMMKVSDPVIFGHAVRVYFRKLITQHAPVLEKLGVDFNNGFGDLINKLDQLDPATRSAIETDIASAYAHGPDLAQVNSDKGITNLHVPSDVIVDASMPAMIREGGKMWDAEGKTRDTLAVIPDQSYAGVYQAVIDFCKHHGALDPVTMGSVPNIGLMAQKAEEYGSHDKTFIIPTAGTVRVIDADGHTLLEHSVREGDIWRACQTKDPAIQDWIRLAVERCRLSATPGVFWLDEKRAHDAELIKKIQATLSSLDTAGLDLRILPPQQACTFTLERLVQGHDTLSITGNVLRDYLTDLFPILEVGTSAKMLSIVPLMNGGGLFETGAGGSAPKHVQQFLEENYLRWDSLGEFLALAVSFEHLSRIFNHPPARILAETLDAATGTLLQENKSPSRKVGGIDNRGSHFYLALFWARELASQDADPALKAHFTPVAQMLTEKEPIIVQELLAVQKQPVDIGGYYHPDSHRATQALRPSSTLNSIIP